MTSDEAKWVACILDSGVVCEDGKTILRSHFHFAKEEIRTDWESPEFLAKLQAFPLTPRLLQILQRAHNHYAGQQATKLQPPEPYPTLWDHLLEA